MFGIKRSELLAGFLFLYLCLKVQIFSKIYFEVDIYVHVFCFFACVYDVNLLSRSCSIIISVVQNEDTFVCWRFIILSMIDWWTGVYTPCFVQRFQN